MANRSALDSEDSEVESAPNTDAEDDVTAWRAGEEDDGEDEGAAVDDRVAGAFDALNSAIANIDMREAEAYMLNDQMMIRSAVEVRVGSRT